MGRNGGSKGFLVTPLCVEHVTILNILCSEIREALKEIFAEFFHCANNSKASARLEVMYPVDRPRRKCS